MEYYIDKVAEIYKSYNQELESGKDKLSNYYNNIIIWLISLSTGLIALIFATNGKINSVSQFTINCTLVILSVTIISGVLGRFFNAISDYYSYRLNPLFNFNLRKLDIYYSPRELKGDETADLIYQYIKIDFNIDFPFIIENMKSLNGKQLDEYHKFIREFYQRFAVELKKDMKNAGEVIEKRMIELFGYKKDHFEKMKISNNSSKGVKMRRIGRISMTCYILCFLSFIAAIIIVTLDFIMN